MFDNGYAHYLSYGATDQQTVRELAGEFSGLLVPGTVAAFQAEGTGGFVLTLSAGSSATPYVIDPRTPLFQQALPTAKRSHESLASLLGSPALVTSAEPSPDTFTDELITTIARSWVSFNGSYPEEQGGKFDKYAKRLGEAVQPKDAQSPLLVLAPYFMASGLGDPWWNVTRRLFDATSEAMGNDPRCVRVVAAKSVKALQELLPSVPDDRVAIWVSNLDELTSLGTDLAHYGSVISQASGPKRLFALYGGFFGVLLGNCGLGGSSHGIGYGEYRDWIELPQSGPPPARYYLPQLHRYVQPDEAARLYFADERLASCPCVECGNEPPLGLDYHSLMKHSARCRGTEIASWRGLAVDQMLERLSREVRDYREILHSTSLPSIVIDRTERNMAHLDRWVDALGMLGR